MKQLERNLGIEKLNVGDIVATEGKYINSKGCYFPMGKGYRVKRINAKSVSLAVLEWQEDKWIETETIRISKQAEQITMTGRVDVEPLFARDNSRLNYTPEEILERTKK